MSALDYGLFLVSQAFSELGDQLWNLGVRNYLFENSPWTPAAGLAAVFVIQAIPLFLFAPWLSTSIQQRWRSMALAADTGRLFVTLAFAVFVWQKHPELGQWNTVALLLTTQFLLEIGSLVFQNCRNCLIPVLYPREEDITQAHLWANVASLAAAGVVPLVFMLALPSGGRIQLEWLMWAAFIDALTFAVSGGALIALKRSSKLRHLSSQTSAPSLTAQDTSQKRSPWQQLREGFRTARKYPAVVKILFFSFLYNLLLMGPVEIGLVTYLRGDLQLPPVALALNLVIFLAGILLGTLLAHSLWKSRKANHLRRFSHSILWDGLTFFPICLFTLFREEFSQTSFFVGLTLLFLVHYMVVPFVKVSRMAAIQTLSPKHDWSALLGFHAIAVDGAAAVSVIAVALVVPELSGTALLAWGGLGATLCGGWGLFALTREPRPSRTE